MEKEIAQHYVNKILPSDYYLSTSPVRILDLLYPPFHDLLKEAFFTFCENFKEIVTMPFVVESYRSNALQLKYYKSKASKIRENGMHHFGIAADIAFKVDNEITYNGNYELLREIFSSLGLHLLGSWDMGHVQFIPATPQAQNKVRDEVVIAIKEFQRKHKLKADGIAGKETINVAKFTFLNNG